MNGPPPTVGSVPGAPVLPGTAIYHRCPTCGHGHWPPSANHPECLCGHPRLVHDDNGGRRKRAPCTTWIDLDTTPIQCPCEDYHP